MSPIALLIAGIIQFGIALVLIIGRRPIADWLATNIAPLDVAWFHVRGELLMGFVGLSGCIGGIAFLALGSLSLASA
ncbi:MULTISPECIES: hypothetical protein [unclassified Agromyces]|uniref:hypothetical protein n=1 Tax=unclassified Agromyces TaxID=2639701 RepID=UPI003672E3EE